MIVDTRPPDQRSKFSPSARDWLYAGFVFLGSLISFLFGLLLVGAAASAYFNDTPQEALGATATAIAFFFMAGLGLIALYGAVKALLGRKPPGRTRPSIRWGILLVLYPISLLIGFLAFQESLLPVSLILPAQIAAAGAPVLLVILIVRGAGPPISARRSWGQFLTGLWAVPPVALFFEALFLLPFIVLFILGLAFNPELIDVIQSLAIQLPTLTPNQALEFGAELITQPWVLALILIYVALVVPLIEEFFKTMAVWPFLRRGLSGGEAFLGGALAGAGYALFEAYFLTQPGETWAATMIGRAGATGMHSFTAGLVSWGLMEGVVRRRWKRTLGSYALAVTLHGVWNASAIAIAAAGVGVPIDESAFELNIQAVIILLGLAVLVTLSVGSYVLLYKAFERINASENAEPNPPGNLVKEFQQSK